MLPHEVLWGSVRGNCIVWCPGGLWAGPFPPKPYQKIILQGFSHFTKKSLGPPWAPGGSPIGPLKELLPILPPAALLGIAPERSRLAPEAALLRKDLALLQKDLALLQKDLAEFHEDLALIWKDLALQESNTCIPICFILAVGNRKMCVRSLCVVLAKHGAYYSGLDIVGVCRAGYEHPGC